MSKESSVGGILCWDKSGVIKVNAKAKKYESLGGILLGGIHQEESCVGGILCCEESCVGGILCWEESCDGRNPVWEESCVGGI